MLRKPVLIVAAAAAVVTALAYGAYATTGVGSPAPLTFTVPGDSNGSPLAVTVSASGFTPNQQVFVEQCDGVSPTAPGWNATIDCDLGTSPSPAIADSTGSVTFSSGDPNHAFTPFKGVSPQDEFNCLAPEQPSPQNGLADFRNCQIRVSSNNTVATADQVFFTMVLPDAPAVALTDAGHCSLGKNLASVKTATKGAGLTDQTQDVKIGAKTLNDVHVPGTKTPLAGTCTGLVDSYYAKTGQLQNSPSVVTGTLHQAKLSVLLSGSASCAWDGPAIAADANASAGYGLSGVLNITFTELNALGKPYKLSAEVHLHHSLDVADIWDFDGIVTKGLSVGANISGSAYLDPVAKFSGTATSIKSNAGPVPAVLPVGYTSYGLDSVGGNFDGCGDGIADNTVSAANVVPAKRTDTATVTQSSVTVADTSITAGDLHKPVSGAGIPAASFVGTVTPGVGFQLSSSSTSQVDVNATNNGTKVTITNPVAYNIKAQTGLPLLQMGDGVSLIGNAASGLDFTF